MEPKPAEIGRQALPFRAVVQRALKICSVPSKLPLLPGVAAGGLFSCLFVPGLTQCPPSKSSHRGSEQVSDEGSKTQTG